MPANKNAVTRYYILDKLLANRYHNYSTEDLCRLVNEELEEREQQVSRRTIELDLHYLEHESPFVAEIEHYQIDDVSPRTFKTIKKYCHRYADPSFSIFKEKMTDDEKYLLNTYISAFETGTKLNNFYFTKRMSAKDTDVIINSMDITSLPSGNYYLVLEARDRNNNIIGLNRYFFQRSNPYYHVDNAMLATINPNDVFSGKISNLDSIKEYIKYLAPISTLVEKDYAEELVKTNDVTTMQQFFYTFWSSRDKIDPKQAWEDYHKQVLAVNASFKTINLKGYESDRGVVYLKYGTPDRIVQSYNEPGAFPYEIWHYYTLGTQRNKKFVFMTRDIVTNDFKLIHSDAVGELNNFRWTTEIYQRTYGTYNDYGVDGVANPDSYGDKAKDYYDNPR